MLQAMRKIIILLMLVILFSSCAARENREIGYKEMKSMVLDILQTDEAQKAISEANMKKTKKLSEEEKTLQMLSSPHGEQMKEAVKNILTDPNNTHVLLKKIMTDPKFAGEFAKAIQEENKQIHKQLLTDPEYQALLIDVMKGSDYERLMVDIMKGKEYRQHTMRVMEEALNNPLFRLELIELMKKAIEEESNPDQEGKDEKKREDSNKDDKQAS